MSQIVPPVRCSLLVLAACLLSAFASAQSVTYRAVILQPLTCVQSWAYGVFAGLQGGSATLQGYNAPTHAFLWSGSASNYVDFTPSGFISTAINGLSDGVQVGEGSGTATQGHGHALLWTGAPESYVDLNPPGYYSSNAIAADGNSQVGVGDPDPNYHAHAVLWHGTSASYVDLNPGVFLDSVALGVSGAYQVGYGSDAYIGGNLHGLLWNGTAASMVDLTSANFPYTVAQGIEGNTQVGYGQGPGSNNQEHALMWHGTAASVVDLTPNGYTLSWARAISHGLVVGWAAPPLGGIHAFVWNLNNNTTIDLHQFTGTLSWGGNSVTFTHTEAWGVDPDGQVVGYGVDAGNNPYAVLWFPIVPVTGTVNLQSYSTSPAGVSVTVQFYRAGTSTLVDAQSAFLDASGTFRINTTASAGYYDIFVKASHWLRQKLANQFLSSTGLSGLAYSLVNGDVNGDNVVSLGDFAQLRAAYGSSFGSGNWNPNADLNGDGSVGLGDFAVLRSHYGQQGD